MNAFPRPFVALLALALALPLPGVAHPTGSALPPISINVKDADLENVFLLFAEVGDLNVVLDPVVKGKTITLNLKEVPFDQALELVLKTHGLAGALEGNVLRVAPVNKLAAEEQQLAAFRKAQEETGELRLISRTLSHGQANNAEQMVKPLLTPRGTTMVDKRTNTLYIRDIVPNVEEIAGILDLYDPASPVATQRGGTGSSAALTLEVRTYEVGAGALESLGLEAGRDALLPGRVRVRPLTARSGQDVVQQLERLPGTSLIDGSRALVGLDRELTLDLSALRASEQAEELRLLVSPRRDGGAVVLTFRLLGATSGRSMSAFATADRAMVIGISSPTPDGREVRHAIVIEAVVLDTSF